MSPPVVSLDEKKIKKAGTLCRAEVSPPHGIEGLGLKASRPLPHRLDHCLCLRAFILPGIFGILCLVSS